MKVYWKKLHPYAQAPSKGTPGSVGWDLCTIDGPMTLYSDDGRRVRTLSTGVAVACPPGVWLKLFDRSGLASRGELFVHAGVIDTDYRGEIKVVVSTANGCIVRPGDRIAQMVVMPHIDYSRNADEAPSEVWSDWHWVEATDEQWAALSDTTRGNAGFGSTGR